MAQAYIPPGTNVTEIVSPSISPLLASPADVCLIGLSQGYQKRTDQITLTGTTGIKLPFLQTLSGSKLTKVVSVKDALYPQNGKTDGSGYELTTDYTVNLEEGTISRVGAGKITDPTIVNVTYEYVPANYYSPIRLFDLGSVESRFGPAFNAAGTAINSQISYAANLAFQNGAGSIICQPLFARQTPGDPTTAQVQPTEEQIAASVTWKDTLFVLRTIEDLNIIVPIVGQSTASVTDAAQVGIFQTIQDHQAFMNVQQQYILGIFGEDSSAGNSRATMATIRTHAASLKGRYGEELNQQNVLINSANFSVPLPATNNTLAVGGQYMAAAIAGAIASRPVSSSLTRKAISGFSAVNDSRLLSDKNIDASTGLMVIEQVGPVVRCRHSITMDNNKGSARSELSVVRAKFLVVESVRATLENQIIGQIIADGNSPFVVRSAISGVLAALQQGQDIIEYSQVNAWISSLEPTTIDASFSYRPAFTVNNVNVSFTLDLTKSTVTVNETESISNPQSTL